MQEPSAETRFNANTPPQFIEAAAKARAALANAECSMEDTFQAHCHPGILVEKPVQLSLETMTKLMANDAQAAQAAQEAEPKRLDEPERRIQRTQQRYHREKRESFLLAVVSWSTQLSLGTMLVAGVGHVLEAAVFAKTAMAVTMALLVVTIVCAGMLLVSSFKDN